MYKIGPKMTKNTSLAAPGALAHRLQRRTACNAAEANLHSPNQKQRSLFYSNLGAPMNFRDIIFIILCFQK